MRTAVLRYRVMAYITGVLIIVVVFAGIPLQLAAHNTFIANDIGTVHGFLYIVYVIVAYLLARKLKMKIGPTIVLLLAGTIPVMTFVVERWMTRSYIRPALAAETAGTPLTMAQLRQRMDVSPAAITYLVDRMIDAGHVRRESDPSDRRKALLRYEESGMELAHGFFTPLGTHLRAELAGLPDRDLLAAHRVFAAMITAMAKFEAEIGLHQSKPSTAPATAPSDVS